MEATIFLTGVAAGLAVSALVVITTQHFERVAASKRHKSYLAQISSKECSRCKDNTILQTHMISRRVAVEQAMFDAARGKRAMPDSKELHSWALSLGTIDEKNQPVRDAAVRLCRTH